MFKNLPGIIRKLTPSILLLALVYVAGATDLFSAAVRQLVAKVFQDFTAQIMPFTVNAVVGVIVLNLAYVFYQPVTKGVNRFLDSRQASERFKNMFRRGLQLVYWAIVIFFAMSVIAPGLAVKLVASFGLFAAAVIVALQDLAKDIAYSVVLHLSDPPRFKVGDNIAVTGLDVTGRVVEIEFLFTRIETGSGSQTIPNREIWARGVKVLNPPPSPIVLPPGVSRVEKEEKPPAPKPEQGLLDLTGGLFSLIHKPKSDSPEK